MQTFLPYRSFESSARVLDNKRLGKQRVEVMQIMAALVKLQVHTDTANIAWGNHPATKMWKGYEFALMSYQEAVCAEWARRGFNDTCRDKTKRMFDLLPEENRKPKVPKWLGLKKFHSAHRANLLRKDPDHYGRFGWKEEPQEGYWWPVV
jgi:hypothetical protein